MKMMLAFAHASANDAFSERNPYPGWMASAFVRRAAAMTLSMSRYDIEGSDGPRCTATSASATNGASTSASEYTATVRMPISTHERKTRRAISPRLATRTVRIMDSISSHPKDAEFAGALYLI